MFDIGQLPSYSFADKYAALCCMLYVAEEPAGQLVIPKVQGCILVHA